MNLTKSLLTRRDQDPDLMAIVDSSGTGFTYSGLTVAVSRLAATLNALSVGPGDSVHLVMLDRAQTVAWFLAVIAVGAVAVMTNPRAKRSNLDDMLHRLPCKLVVTEHNLLQHIQDITSATVITHDHDMADDQDAVWFDDEDAPACILWSSGTTGKPKAVVHGHSNLWHCAMINAPVFNYRHGGRAYVTAKMIHAVGICNVLYALYQGTCIYLDSDLVIPSRVRKNLLTFKPDVMISISGIYAALINQFEIPHLPNTQFIAVGDRVYQTLVDAWNSKSGNRLYITYGMSEFLTQAFFNSQGTTDDLGDVVPGWQVRLVDDRNNEVDSGIVGRLLVKSLCQGLGYWPHMCFGDRIMHGWYDTGDLAIKIDNKFYYQGRGNNDVVKLMGTFINLSNIETVILQCPGVEQAAVSLYQNDIGHDELGAIIVPADPHQSGSDLMQSLRYDLMQSLGKLERPRLITFVEEIPRTDNGKISRVLISEILRSINQGGHKQ